jgi:uncharacterized iron-regulated membrane protein
MMRGVGWMLWVIIVLLVLALLALGTVLVARRRRAGGVLSVRPRKRRPRQ